MSETQEATVVGNSETEAPTHEISKYLPISAVQMKLAMQNPRDENMVFETMIADLRTHWRYAEDMYYSIPYKDYQGDKGEKITMVEGLTIKAAMTFANRWGNCATAGRIGEELDDYVMALGYYMDYQKNMYVVRSVRVARIAKTRDGRFYRLDPNRLNLAIMAGQSKAIRNAVLASLDEWHKDLFFEEAKKLVMAPPGNTETAKARIAKAKDVFAKNWKVTAKEFDDFIGVIVADSDGQISDDEILAKLVGLRSALKEGHITVERAFNRTPENPGAAMPKEKTAPEETQPKTTAPKK